MLRFLTGFLVALVAVTSVGTAEETTATKAELDADIIATMAAVDSAVAAVEKAVKEVRGPGRADAQMKASFLGIHGSLLKGYAQSLTWKCRDGIERATAIEKLRSVRASLKEALK